MIYGIGIDLIEIKRISEWFIKKPRMTEKILTIDELKILNSIENMERKIEFIAGRFTVKEAFSKAMGTGIGKSFGFLDINCLPDENGKPQIFIEGFKVHVSITHTKEYAESVVLIEQL